jgi:hypothetical protein
MTVEMWASEKTGSDTVIFPTFNELRLVITKKSPEGLGLLLNFPKILVELYII